MPQAVSEFISQAPTPRELEHIDNLAARLANAAPEETLRWAIDEFDRSVTIATGFGMEGVALIDMAVKINPCIDVFFLDTAFLFPETYDLRRRLEDRYHIKISAYETDITPEQQALRFGAALWAKDPDLCCRLRKLEPLKDALRGRRAWITAIRHGQTPERSLARVVEWDYQWRLIKINPLVRWTTQDVRAYIAKNNVPFNPLHDHGYPSIGCTHCTRAIGKDQHERDGRWPGHEKRECGMHAGVQPVTLITTDSTGDETGEHEHIGHKIE
ncbi:MAG TPA: phosphoadenylyl-sulfate reductase [Blastocatellia bacterium]|nr:phosphoadenylyl-sulfate reductase [Blastocatellia bacterium]